MINTVETKEQQLKKGFYSIGKGYKVILIIGSCRSVPYITYFDNIHTISHYYTIAFIDPFNFNWDENDSRVDYGDALLKCESNPELLDLLSRTEIFVHEYYANAGMFNCSKDSEKNIYQFGMAPQKDICIPNFNDVFILTKDIVSFDMEIRKKVIQDLNVLNKLSESTLFDIELVRKKNLQRFYDICSKTDFPEFAEIFATQYKDRRFFWTFNHVSKHFTQEIFRMMCSKYLDIYLPDFKLSEEDLYANNYTKLTEYDFGYKWNEKSKLLKEMI